MHDIHVAVGVIRNQEQQVLIAKRPAHVHLGGLWEFPGGKVEHGESVQEALQRELKEELNISFEFANSKPLLQIKHQYSEKTVLLDVWMIDKIHGHPFGCENQIVRWVGVDELGNFNFPEANRAIVTALTLPNKYLITGGYVSDDEFEQRLHLAINKGITLIQLRAKSLPHHAFVDVAQRAIRICRQHNVKILLNASPEIIELVDADGIHLTSNRLSHYSSRPVALNKYLFASCHNEHELQQAIRLNVDAIVLGPVAHTLTHPDAPILGWQQFAVLVKKAPMPVFALGGLKDKDLPVAMHYGAQGIAAISAWW